MLATSTRLASPVTLLRRLSAARAETDTLFQLLDPVAMYDRPIPERHRIIFYLGHLDAFDWNLFLPHLNGVTSPAPQLDRLFAFGIDPIGGGLPADTPKDWPTLKQVHSYKDKIREQLDAALPKAAAVSDLSQLLNVAIEHRLIHAETLAYMFHQLPLDRKLNQRQVKVAETVSTESPTVDIPAGPATLGNDEGSFGWDNEFETHTVSVPSFTIDRFKITNGQYLEFVRSGGYRDHNLWTAAAWDWKEQSGIKHPTFWKPVGQNYILRTMFGQIELPLTWPVYVSFAEANAYALWAGKRLPTEAEWHRAAYGSVIETHAADNPYPWAKPCDDASWDRSDDPGINHGYFDFARWDPYSVAAFPANRSEFGVHGLLANGWEWTSSVLAPFPGFKPFPFYPGYSADFFDGQHYVMKGGSTRTERSMLRRSFRNWFQPHYPYTYTGFRLAQD